MIYLYLQKSSIWIPFFAASPCFSHCVSCTSAQGFPLVTCIKLGRSSKFMIELKIDEPLQTTLLIFFSQGVSASIRSIFVSASGMVPMNALGHDQKLKCGITQYSPASLGRLGRANDHACLRVLSSTEKVKMVSGSGSGEVLIAR